MIDARERSKQRGYDIARLRADYKRSLAVPGKPPATSLPFGLLWFLSDREAGIGATMCNRAMTPDEWDAYSWSPASFRRRRERTRLEELQAEIRRKEFPHTFAGTVTVETIDGRGEP